MEYKDYYNIMGVERTATQDEIKRAYRLLARKYHPDVSKEKDAEARFKEVGEAYEVLKDPEKRAAYDQLGNNWQNGQDFKAPPNWDAGFEYSGAGDQASGGADYSAFFESLFGKNFRSQYGGERGPSFQARGEDHHAKIAINIEDSYYSATHTITLKKPTVDDSGRVTTREHKLNVTIPRGIYAGQHIRLAGQGSPGLGQGKAGDLYLEIEFRPHTLYKIDERDVTLELPIAPWEAALGATVKVPTPSGIVELKIPPNSVAGRKLRLKERGLPATTPGDFYVVLKIALPDATDEKAKNFYKAMSEQFSSFNPRTTLGV
jgi:curved DNA-binding protein